MNLDLFKWIGLLLCYAVCSGANVAYFAFSFRDLRKKITRGEKPEASNEEKVEAKRAAAILGHLENPNWTLAAILLTNVVFGVLLSQLSDGLFTGILAVLAPVVGITIVGEFLAQATFLRFAGFICALFSPVIWVLKILTAPISWPLAWCVNKAFGRDAIKRLDEKDLLSDLELEMTEFADSSPNTDDGKLDKRELRTLMNVAIADDELASSVGEVLDPDSIIEVEFESSKPVFPNMDNFVGELLQQSSHPWFVVVDAESNKPRLLLDVDGFVRGYYRDPVKLNPQDHLYHARFYYEPNVKLGDVVSGFQVREEHPGDDVIDVDVALIWTDDKKHIITGGDILGRILRGVSKKVPG